MSRLTRLIIPLLLAQAACLALGLWLQDRFSDSMSTWKANEELVADEISLTDDQTNTTSGELNPETPKAAAKSTLLVQLIAFSWIIGLQGVAAYLIISRANTEHIRQQRARHEESLHKSRELVQTRDAVVFGLAKLAESRDPETGQHLERIAMYSTRLAAALRHDPKYREQINSNFVKLIGISSALHDIGKVGVPDSILLKPGPLTEAERELMQQHVAVGGDCISEIERRLGNSNFLGMARDIAYYHHERWDGKGYGKGMVAEEIPLAARIVSIADVYDALRTKRVYKDEIPHEECMIKILENAGTQFDPGIVKVFEKIEHQFCEISIRFCDRAVRDAERKADLEAEKATNQREATGALKETRLVPAT